MPTVRRRRPGLYALVYGVPAPWQVTVVPSPGCQVTETGVAVAVTLSPGTVAVLDSGTQTAGLIHSQVGRFVSCKAVCAGLEWITGLGSTRYFRARGGSADRAGQRLHRDRAAGRDAAECLAHRARASPRTAPAPQRRRSRPPAGWPCRSRERPGSWNRGLLYACSQQSAPGQSGGGGLAMASRALV